MKRFNTGQRTQPPGRLNALITLVAAIALLFASGPTTYLLHFSAVRHVVCEHGELVHVDSDEEATPAARPRSDAGFPACSAGSQHAAGTHHHCEAGARGRYGQARLTAPRDAVAVPASTGSGPTPAASIWVDRQGVLHFAPKTSPPVCA